MPRPFKSELVIEEKISEATFRAYNVGFDQNKFRLQELVDVIRSVIPEFALGYYGGNFPPAEIMDKLKEAASTIYDTDKYKKRGEFGELILHLLLRDFCNSVPLIAKIYFKDAINATVHGFDGVHAVNGATKKLWLGESKLYASGKAGVKELIKDLKNHIKADYLQKEFTLLKRKLPEECTDIEYWRTLMDKHQTLDKIYDGICIPLLCTYSSEMFKKHKSNTEEYLQDFIEECRSLKKILSDENLKTDIDVVLMLLPVPCKNILNKELNVRLKHMQKI